MKYEERGMSERERKEGRQVGEGQDSVLSVRGGERGGERRGRQGGREGREWRAERTMSATHTGLSSVV